MPDAPEDMGTQPSSSPAETNTGGAPIQTAKSFHSEEGDEDEDTCDAEDDEEPDTKSTTTTTNPNTIQHANSNPNAKSDVKPADSFLANPPVPVVSQPASQAAPAPSSTAPAAAGASSGAPVVAQGSGDKTNLATTTVSCYHSRAFSLSLPLSLSPFTIRAYDFSFAMAYSSLYQPLLSPPSPFGNEEKVPITNLSFYSTTTPPADPEHAAATAAGKPPVQEPS